MNGYTFSMDYYVEAPSKKEASRQVKELVLSDAKDNLTEESIYTFLGKELTFSHITEDL